MDVVLLGEIQDLIDGVNTNIANAKSVVDTINNNTKANNTASETGTLSQKLSSIISYTKTNNTASTTGTLSQKISSAISNTAATTTENSSGTLSAKLTYLINRRNRGVKPSSTNIKTFSNNLKTSTSGSGTSTQTVYSSYTSEYVVAYTGRYRAYCTGTVTVSALGTASNYSSYSQTEKNYLKFEVWVNGQTYTSGVVATQGRTVGTSAAATGTLDLTLEAGQVVKMRVVAISEYYYVNCVGPYCANKVYATATDLSIRGTTVELTGAAIV